VTQPDFSDKLPSKIDLSSPQYLKNNELWKKAIIHLQKQRKKN
jgi:hypothetical protein